MTRSIATLPLVVLLALAVNFNVLTNGFGWDDEIIIRDIRMPNHWWQPMVPDPDLKQDAVYFRPVIHLSYLLDYALWGHRPFGFHLSVFLAHLINTALVFLLAQGLISPPFQSALSTALRRRLPPIAAALFAVHPAHAEAVAWIAGRNDVFCATFMFASLVFYLRFHSTDRRIFYGLAMLAFALSLLTKEIAVGLLPFFPLIDYLARPPQPGRAVPARADRTGPARRMALRALTPLTLVALYFLWRQVQISRPFGDATPAVLTDSPALVKLLGAIGLYLKTMIFPYPHQPFIAAVPTSVPYGVFSILILTAALTAGVIALRRRDALPAVSGAWFFAMLAPALAVAVLLIASTPAAERYLYAPSAGFLILLADGGLLAFERLSAAFANAARPIRAAAIMVFVALLATWGWTDRSRNLIWKSPLSFWEAAVAAAPRAGLPYRELAGRYAEQGQQEKAEQLNLKAVAIDEKNLGPEHPETGASLHNLASLYHNLNRYAEAEPLYLRALAIWEKAVGTESPDVAIGVNNLAGLYYLEGKYDQAESLYRRSLAIWEKLRGPDQPDVAQSLSNLGAVYRAQGRHADAVSIYQRALTILEKTPGTDRLDVAQNLDNLAEIYTADGKHDQAEPLYQRALAIREKALGPDHPDLVTGLNHLAGIYYNQGKYSQAEPLYQRALAVREKALGPDHPDVAQSLNFMAALFYAQRQYAKAEPLYQRALAVREKALGPDHPDVAQSLNNLAVLYHTQGQYAKAEPLLRRSLSIREKALGSDHPDLATGMNNLAGLYFAEGKYAEAEPLYRRALAIREKALGPNHPDLASTLSNYAALLRKMNRPDEAARMERRAGVIRNKHP